jgi:hypothetical protein
LVPLEPSFRAQNLAQSLHSLGSERHFQANDVFKQNTFLLLATLAFLAYPVYADTETATLADKVAAVNKLRTEEQEQALNKLDEEIKVQKAAAQKMEAGPERQDALADVKEAEETSRILRQNLAEARKAGVDGLKDVAAGRKAADPGGPKSQLKPDSKLSESPASGSAANPETSSAPTSASAEQPPAGGQPGAGGPQAQAGQQPAGKGEGGGGMMPMPPPPSSGGGDKGGDKGGSDSPKAPDPNANANANAQNQNQNQANNNDSSNKDSQNPDYAATMKALADLKSDPSFSSTKKVASDSVDPNKSITDSADALAAQIKARAQITEDGLKVADTGGTSTSANSGRGATSGTANSGRSSGNPISDLFSSSDSQVQLTDAVNAGRNSSGSNGSSALVKQGAGQGRPQQPLSAFMADKGNKVSTTNTGAVRGFTSNALSTTQTKKLIPTIPQDVAARVDSKSSYASGPSLMDDPSKLLWPARSPTSVRP